MESFSSALTSTQGANNTSPHASPALPPAPQWSSEAKVGPLWNVERQVHVPGQHTLVEEQPGVSLSVP